MLRKTAGNLCELLSFTETSAHHPEYGSLELLQDCLRTAMESETCPVPRTEPDYCRWRFNIAHQLTYQIFLDSCKHSRKFFSAHVTRSADCFRIKGSFMRITEDFSACKGFTGRFLWIRAADYLPLCFLLVNEPSAAGIVVFSTGFPPRSPARLEKVMHVHAK